MKKFFQVLGVSSLFAWTAAGLWAWSAVGDGVRLVVQQGDSPQDEAAALLGDRVSALSADLDALVASLDANFGMLAESLASQAAEGDAERAATRASIEELSAALPALLASLETPARRPVASIAPVAAPVAAPVIEVVEPTEIVELEAPVEAASAPQTAEPEQAPAARSFLAFRLPSRDFQFAGAQTFEVLGDLSRVGFDAKSTLHDFSGVSNRVSGSFRVDLAHPESGLSGAITIPTNSLATGVEGRDEAMLEHLESASNARIEYALQSFNATKSDAKAQVVEGRVRGTLTIRGARREVSMAVRAHVDESRRLVLEGEMPLLLSDFEVPVPSQLGVISMEDEVRVWIHLRARAQAGSATQ